MTADAVPAPARRQDAGPAPRVGIATTTGGAVLASGPRYAAAVEGAGGVPVWLEPSAVRAAPDLAALLDTLDALLLSGGRDIPPEFYGETVIPEAGVEPDAERYAVELPLARAALEADLPVLGICGGMQALAVATGGSLYQDLTLMDGVDPAVHRLRGTMRTHPIRVATGTRLASLLGEAAVEVNSSHHQAVRRLGDGLVAAAWAPDGVLEALEAPGRRFAVGVQWHPERMVDADPRQRRLFEAFVAAARSRRPWKPTG